MPSSSRPAAGAALHSALAQGLDHPVGEGARGFAGFLATAFGPTTVAVIHYGSHAQGRSSSPTSAFDFFVLVDRYRDAYGSLAATVGTHYSVRVATALAAVLAPNVIAVSQRDHGTTRLAKCCVLSLDDFLRACSEHPRDHFTQGRLVQRVLLDWVRDDDSARRVTDAIVRSRARTFTWGRPSLPARFTVDDYCRAVLARSLAGEIRPESGDHARALVEAQREGLRAIYTRLLDELVEREALTFESDGRTYALRNRPTRVERLRVSLYFQRSKVRATLRLLKHVILYEGWLDYIVRKIDRSSGATIELTARERRWPLLFLWPKFFHYLWSRPQRQRRHDAD